MSKQNETNANDAPVAIELPAGETFTPNQLATLIFGATNAHQGGKRVRAYLRAKYVRPSDAKNTSWVLARDVAQDVLDTFTAKTVSAVITTNDSITPSA